MKDLLQSLHDLKETASLHLPAIRLQISHIIKSRNENVEEIEELLDILLNYQLMEVGEEEFKILNTYYGTFDLEASQDWIRIAKDLLDDTDN